MIIDDGGRLWPDESGHCPGRVLNHTECLVSHTAGAVQHPAAQIQAALRALYDIIDGNIDQPLRRHVGVGALGMANTGDGLSGFGQVNVEIGVIAHIVVGLSPTYHLAVEVPHLRGVGHGQVLPDNAAEAGFFLAGHRLLLPILIIRYS